mgnify:CR=1 FL=1
MTEVPVSARAWIVRFVEQYLDIRIIVFFSARFAVILFEHIHIISSGASVKSEKHNEGGAVPEARKGLSMGWYCDFHSVRIRTAMPPPHRQPQPGECGVGTA